MVIAEVGEDDLADLLPLMAAYCEFYGAAPGADSLLALSRTLLEDPERDGLQRTPARVADMYAELFAGLHDDPAKHLTITFEANHDEMVMVRDIPLYSVCEHHLAPFHGRAHVAYIPGDDGRITGLSKLARLVDGFARRPQVQERLTTQVADALMDVLKPAGVFVVIEAEHLCMSLRGVQKAGTRTMTSALLGLLRDDARTRSELFSLVQDRR